MEEPTKRMVYFAVTRYNDRIYLTEREQNYLTEREQKNDECIHLINLIDDYTDLQNELDWSELNETCQPNELGCYRAIVECRQTAEDDYSLVVTSCTPTYLI